MCLVLNLRAIINVGIQGISLQSVTKDTCSHKIMSDI